MALEKNETVLYADVSGLCQSNDTAASHDQIVNFASETLHIMHCSSSNLKGLHSGGCACCEVYMIKII